MNEHYRNSEIVQKIYDMTLVLRKPISGIVSGYHQLPYIFVSPDDRNDSRSVEVRGKINVSPKFIISPNKINETFGEIFDPETFDKSIEGRTFAFSYSNKKDIKVESEYFEIQNHEQDVDRLADKMLDSLLREENTRTSLIKGPDFHYYPVSLDRFISEIVDREFNI
jgi:hypothetical protein